MTVATCIKQGISMLLFWHLL